MRFTPHRAPVLLFALVAAHAGYSAETPAKPAAAPPTITLGGAPTASRLEADDVQKLRDSIDALLKRYERQGEVLTKIQDSLERFRVDAETNFRRLDLEPVQKNIVIETVKRTDELKVAQGNLAKDFEANVKADEAKFAQLATALDRVSAQLAALEKLPADLGQLRTTLSNASSRPATAVVPAEPAAPTTTLLALGVCTVLLIATVLYSASAQRRALAAATATAVGQARDQLTASLQQVSQSSASERDRTLTGREQSVADTLAQLQKLAARFELLDRRSDDVATKRAVVPATVPSDEKTTVPRPAPSEPSIPSEILWAPPFLNPASPLARWRALLEAHLASPDHPALPVLSALLRLRVLLSSPSPAQPDVVEAVAALSQAAHAYWQSLSDLNEDDRQRASADWIGGIKQLISPVAPKLDLREIVPGARIDPDTMQTVREGPGNHLNVAAVFSWAILDRSGDRPKVLHRARIATT
jgi:hypothetical protein